MKAVEISSDASSQELFRDPEVAEVKRPQEWALDHHHADGAVDHEKHPRAVSVATGAKQALNSETPIANLYLTFDSSLPAVNRSESISGELPPFPDLAQYTDPHNWPETRKNAMLLLSCLATAMTAYTAGVYSPPVNLMAVEFGASRVAVLVGITMFTLGFALAPMALAPFSEINGRYPVFVIAGVIWVVFQLVCGFVPDLAGMLIARFIVGAGSSVFSTMVGGVIADLWTKEGRNTPMSLFSGSVLFGTGLGPLIGSIITQRLSGPPHAMTGPMAPWRWVFWHQVILDAALIIALIILFHETRGSVLLSRKAKKLNAWYAALEGIGVYGVWLSEDDSHRDAASPSMGNSSVSDEEKAQARRSLSDAENVIPKGCRLERIRWLVKEDEQRSSLAKMISLSLYRPFHLLFTEPIVFFFTVWLSFAWAALYLTFGAIPLVLSRQYGFNTEQSGYVFAAIMVGAIVATAMGIYQERMLRHPFWQRMEGLAGPDDRRGGAVWTLLRQRFPAEAPESRLYFTCLLSILLPVGLYVFGFASRPSVHWIVPAIAILFSTIGIYYIYLATFNYFADSYQAYASSALAAQSFGRNILGGVFPLVVTPLFTNLGEAAAGGILGSVALALTVVPWVLVFYGEKIRSRSRFAVALGGQ